MTFQFASWGYNLSFRPSLNALNVTEVPWASHKQGSLNFLLPSASSATHHTPLPFVPLCFLFPSPLFLCLNKLNHPPFLHFLCPQELYPSLPCSPPSSFSLFLHYLWLSFYHKSLPPLSPNILLYFSMPLTSCMTYPIPLSLPCPHPPSFPLFLNHLWMLRCHQGQIRHREA